MIVRIIEESDYTLTYIVLLKSIDYMIFKIKNVTVWDDYKINTITLNIEELDKLLELQKDRMAQPFWKAKQRGFNEGFYECKGWD